MNDNIEYVLPVVAGTILFGLLTVFIVFFILQYRRTRIKLHWERERMQQELLRVENEVKEQTLLNVSRELHDNFGQIAALIKINLNLLSKSVKDEPLEQVKESLDLIKQLLTDIKTLSASLNGERLKNRGWIQAVSEDIERINKLGELNIHFDCKGTSRLSDDKQVVIYRITQELLSNTLKHAKANSASVRIYCTEDIYLHYEDNGIGFDESEIIPGQGIENMRQRCQLISAAFSINSIPGKGTNITLNLANNDK